MYVYVSIHAIHDLQFSYISNNLNVYLSNNNSFYNDNEKRAMDVSIKKSCEVVFINFLLQLLVRYVFCG